MKVNLLIDGKSRVLGTHLNLDLGLEHPSEDPGDIRQPCPLMDWPGVSPNEAEEIVAYGILDRMPENAVEAIFTYWVSRLALGGRLVFSALDIMEACSVVGQSSEIEATANTVIYGGRKSAHTVWSLAALAESHGLKVQWKWLDGNQAIVEAVRV